jgi:DNA-binding NarL/FixJ family response regulator
VLVFSSLADRDLIARTRAAGAAGYLHKTCSPDELVDGIRTVAAGGMVWPDGNSDV